jgi:hypothetical protein
VTFVESVPEIFVATLWKRMNLVIPSRLLFMQLHLESAVDDEGRQQVQWSISVVTNLWYPYPWRYAKIMLIMAEDGKKGAKIKTEI